MKTNTAVVLVLAVAGLAAASIASARVDVHDAERGAVWSTHNHGCNGGNHSDALHRDPDGTLWAGCGTNATGYGLFRSTGGGANWTAAPVSPADAFHEFRVNSI